MSGVQAMRDAAARIADQAEAVFRDYPPGRPAEPTQRSMDMALLARSIRALPLSDPQPDPDVEAMAAALDDILRLSDMGFEESMQQPEDNGNFAAYNRARAALANYRASREHGGRT